MATGETKAMDRLELERSGNVVMTVQDDADWGDENGHIAWLQDRLNACLQLVESGEVFDRLKEQLGRPVTRNSPLLIRIVAKHPMSPEGARFFEYAKSEFSEAKVGVSFRLASDVTA
jgi:hypothetical protein